ncbi:GH25286 [Drosophila grimshawi]|uniref:GH25286 n=1 Tax=Drosophila grimshawi TaxID=7222 RepID=B4K317_DROGR|nr:GH25286 [Drosophila grimshawi]
MVYVVASVACFFVLQIRTAVGRKDEPSNWLHCKDALVVVVSMLILHAPDTCPGLLKLPQHLHKV